MLQIVGSLVVIGCILGGFVAEGGHILALWHPFEVLIIVGSAAGAFLISNPPKVVKAAFVGALSLPRGPRYKREHYVTLLQLMYEILTKMRRDGVMSIERDLEAKFLRCPGASPPRSFGRVRRRRAQKAGPCGRVANGGVDHTYGMRQRPLSRSCKRACQGIVQRCTSGLT